ncbi:MAG: flagellar biosynthesis protein FlhB [Alphaproteobacteria bacterium]|nr:flagellar biosynthesis protein FlhB [Alphaproteobacteria bacterium]
MAEEEDKSQKTEEPTQRKLDDARKKGQVATSRELNNALMISAATAFVALLAPGITDDLSRIFIPFISAPHDFIISIDDLRLMAFDLLTGVGGALILPGLLFLTAALASSLLQNGIVVSAEPLKPKLEKLSPISGAKRIFSLKSFVEFVKGLFKIALIGGAAVVLLWPEAVTVIKSAEIEMVGVVVILQSLTLKLLGGVAALVLVIALLDFLYQRFEHQKQLRMSRKDLQDEYKQTEGDPHIKARLKGLRAERARRRMMADVPKATVVVTNPTHFAVALLYEADGMAAPRAIAKGADLIALKIREVAETHSVPVVENPPLARALYAAVELGDEIPPEQYHAVAEVIGYVMRLGRR